MAQEGGAGAMIRFVVLRDLADQVGLRTGRQINITVKYKSYTDAVQYFLIIDNVEYFFDTVQKLKAALEEYLKPTEDEGISV